MAYAGGAVVALSALVWLPMLVVVSAQDDAG
jgi:hypothetical protein